MSAIFVTGAVGSGKSTLLRRVIDTCAPNLRVYGFCTKKLASPGAPASSGKVYIYPASGPLIQDDRYCVAELLPQGSVRHAEVFDTIGAALLTGIPEGSVVIMDELGFLESSSPVFCKMVMEILDGRYLVLGAIKPLDRPFLNAVREHPDIRLFEVTELNRDSVAEKIIHSFRTALERKN